MSIEAHPNFHAVKFVTEITGQWFRSKRLPERNDLRVAYRTAIRGKAEQRHEIDIDLEGMLESFEVVGKSFLSLRDEEGVTDLIARFARQASERDWTTLYANHNPHHLHCLPRCPRWKLDLPGSATAATPDAMDYQGAAR